MKRLSCLDRWLTLWIFAVMAVGVLLGALFPALPGALDALSVGPTNLPIAIGLILMTYPPLAKVRYENLTKVFEDRRILVGLHGKGWYHARFLPRIAPFTLVALLFTIMAMFVMQGGEVLRLPGDALRIAMPLALYFLIQFGIGFASGRLIGADYPQTTTVAFITAGNNFELAIAVAIATFGLASAVAFATLIGPLVDLPVLIGLLLVALWLGLRWFAFTVPGKV